MATSIKAMPQVAMRTFAVQRYHFDVMDYVPTVTQVSMIALQLMHNVIDLNENSWL